MTQAQLQMPQQLAIGVGSANGSFGDRLVATANDLRDYVRTRFNNDASTTGTAFTSAASDIAQRFTTIAALDTDARGSASNEIIALRRYRGALTDQVDREARTVAQRIAAQRGLALTDSPAPGAVDLTPEVMRQLSTIFGH